MSGDATTPGGTIDVRAFAAMVESAGAAGLGGTSSRILAALALAGPDGRRGPDLAAAFGVSRTIVNAAAGKLAALGLVERRGRALVLTTTLSCRPEETATLSCRPATTLSCHEAETATKSCQQTTTLSCRPEETATKSCQNGNLKLSSAPPYNPPGLRAASRLLNPGGSGGGPAPGQGPAPLQADPVPASPPPVAPAAPSRPMPPPGPPDGPDGAVPPGPEGRVEDWRRVVAQAGPISGGTMPTPRLWALWRSNPTVAGDIDRFRDLVAATTPADWEESLEACRRIAPRKPEAFFITALKRRRSDAARGEFARPGDAACPPALRPSDINRPPPYLPAPRVPAELRTPLPEDFVRQMARACRRPPPPHVPLPPAPYVPDGRRTGR